MPLEVRNFGAGEEDVLPGPGGGLLLFNLELHDVGRVLDDFGNIRPMAGTDFPQNTLPDPDKTSDKPVPLEDAERVSASEVEHSGPLLTQKTPMLLAEQYGGLSGLIIHHIPWNCQAMKKTMKRW
jgi:hypothetical protein